MIQLVFARNFDIHCIGGPTGCLQLLEIYRNLKTVLEILEISWNLIGPPGYFTHLYRYLRIFGDLYTKAVALLPLR